MFIFLFLSLTLATNTTKLSLQLLLNTYFSVQLPVCGVVSALLHKSLQLPTVLTKWVDRSLSEVCQYYLSYLSELDGLAPLKQIDQSKPKLTSISTVCYHQTDASNEDASPLQSLVWSNQAVMWKIVTFFTIDLLGEKDDRAEH